jgi:hypothetical protein
MSDNRCDTEAGKEEGIRYAPTYCHGVALLVIVK